MITKETKHEIELVQELATTMLDIDSLAKDIKRDINNLKNGIGIIDVVVPEIKEKFTKLDSQNDYLIAIILEMYNVMPEMRGECEQLLLSSKVRYEELKMVKAMLEEFAV